MSQDSDSELHQTTGGAVANDLPDIVADELPEKYQSEDGLEMADDWMDATVKGSDDTQTVPLVDEQTGRVFVVELTDITWHQVNRALTDALVTSGSGGGKLDFGAYYRAVAEAKIESVEPEVPEEQLTQWLTGLNERLGKQLQNHLPDPIDDIEEDEAKN